MNEVFDNITIKYSTQRRSIAIIVCPDLTIKILAPQKTTDERIKEILTKKQNWITKKLRNYRDAKTLITKLESIDDGQSIYYIGQKTILRIMNQNQNNIILDNNIMAIYSSYNKALVLVNQWLKVNAAKVFTQRLETCFALFSKKFDYQLPQLKIRRMKCRWGSMSSSGIMVLNLCLICVPIECIDYVIMHELCHMKYQNHGIKFHRLQAYFTPNYKEIKKKLEEFILT